MVRRIGGRRAFVLAVVLGISALASRATAQGSLAMVEGTVTDPNGAIVADAKITIKSTDGIRSYETKTDKKGKYIQIGLTVAEYEITAMTDSLQSQPVIRRLPPGGPTKMDLPLLPKSVVVGGGGGGAAAAAAAAETARRDGISKTFGEGVEAANAGKQDLAIAKFKETIASTPNCFACYKNLGVLYGQKKEYAEAEAAFKKAIEIAPSPDAEAYSGLAGIYNSQKKFDLAAEASANAAKIGTASGGGNPMALYTQGANLFNAGKSAEAKVAFQSAIKADPTFGEPHFMLALVLLGDDMKGATTEFETYLKLMPQCAPLLQATPPANASDALKKECANAVQTKGFLATLKK